MDKEKTVDLSRVFEELDKLPQNVTMTAKLLKAVIAKATEEKEEVIESEKVFSLNEDF